MNVLDMLAEVFDDSPEISPFLAPLSPSLARTNSAQTKGFSPFSPFSLGVGVKSTSHQEPTTEPTDPKVDWLKPCPICSGHLFTESDRGGYFCCECQTLPEGAKPARIVESRKAQKSSVKITKLRKKQVNCQAYEQTGVMMSTDLDHCRQWQGSYCSGCALQTIH